MPASSSVGSVVLVGHDASRTGAPRVLLTFLDWIARQGADVRVLLARGGPLQDQFDRRARTVVLEPSVPALSMLVAAGRRGGPLGRAAAAATAAPALVRSGRPQAVLASSLASLDPAVRLARRVRPRRARTVCWVHELDGVAERVLPAGPRRRELLEQVDAFAAVSPAVAAMLTERWGVPAGRVEVVPPFVDEVPAPSEDRARRRERHGMRVLGMGAPGPRKGSERFIDLVQLLGAPSGLSTAWVGGRTDLPVWQEMLADAGRCGTAAPELHPWTDRPGAEIERADLLVSTAIEDPCPLVVLEAGAAGIAVVGHDAGGLGWLLRSAGQPDGVVRVGDTVALAHLVRELLEDPVELDRRGLELRELVREHHVADRLAPRLWELLLG